MNGDPTEWLQHVSGGDDVTILGGWGAYEKGRQPVGARYGWAAARFQPGGARVAVEYLLIVQDGGLAYTVSVERSRVRLAGREGVVPLALRVTHVFRAKPAPGSSCTGTPILCSIKTTRLPFGRNQQFPV